MVVSVTLPPDWVSVRFWENEEVLLVEISNEPVVVTVMSSVRRLPLTVKDWAAEGVPKGVAKPVRLEGVAVMVDAGATVPETETV